MILLESYAIYISIFSLLISFLTLYRQRKRLTVTWQENCYVLNPKTDIFFKGEPYPTSAKVAFYTSVNIVNPSNVNMAFFDLRAFNPKTNENHFIATQRSTLPEVQNNPLFITAFGLENLENFFIKLPARKFGELNAGSYTSIDVLIFANKYVAIDDGIVVSIKVTDTSWFHRSLFSDTNRKIYKAHEFFYNLKGYEEILVSKKGYNNSDKRKNTAQ